MKCDVYSFAIVLWEMFAQEEPFQGKRQTMIIVVFWETEVEFVPTWNIKKPFFCVKSFA